MVLALVEAAAISRCDQESKVGVKGFPKTMEWFQGRDLGSQNVLEREEGL